VPEEFDVTKAATLLVRLHGNHAREVARKRADTRMICGDANGMQAWSLVIKALDDQVGSVGTKKNALVSASTKAKVRSGP
jgi:hypothetical protein